MAEDDFEVLSEVDVVSNGDLIGNVDDVPPVPGTVPYESENPRSRPRDTNGRFTSESTALPEDGMPEIEIVGDFVGDLDEAANFFTPKAEKKAEAPPVKEAEKPVETPAPVRQATALQVPADVLQHASEMGIPPHEATQYSSLRALRAELVTRFVERNPQMFQQQTTKTETPPPEPDFDFDEKKLAEAGFDESLITPLKGMRKENVTLKQELAATKKEIAETRAIINEIQSERRMTAERDAQADARATFAAFDELIDELGPEAAALLGKPSAVIQQPGTEQYQRWQKLGQRYAREIQWADEDREDVDRKTLQMRAIGALHRDLIAKQTRATLEKAVKGQKGSTALRSSPRRTDQKEPTPANIIDRGRAFREALQAAGIR